MIALIFSQIKTVWFGNISEPESLVQLFTNYQASNQNHASSIAVTDPACSNLVNIQSRR
jgi:hypothetical protein